MFRKLTTLFVVLMLATAASAQVMINEFLYDTQGTDDVNLLFTEIYGPPGTNLTGWSLVGINGNNATVYRTVTLQGSIPADGYYVVGNTSQVPNVDYVCGGAATNTGVDWQNAGYQTTPDCDGLDLHNASGVTVDHVCYGICATPANCVGEGGSNAPDYDPPSTGPTKSIARIPDHSDTGDNGVDFQVLDPYTPGAPNSGSPCQPWITDLSALRQNTGTGEPVYLDTFVVVRGIVNVSNYVLDSLTLSRFYMQDDNAGINIFRGNPPPNVVVGDCLIVSGWLGFYRGLTEITYSGSGNCVHSLERVTHVAPPTPTVITGSSPFELFEGMLVRMDNVNIVTGTWPTEGNYGDLIITDDDGQVGLSISKWTNVDGSPAPTPTFHVIGIMTQYDPSSPYNTGYAIIPRSTDDIINVEDAGDPQASLMAREFVLAGSYPNPFNSTAQIRFTVGSARELDLVIFDVLGREMTHEKLTGLTPGARTYSWTPSGATGLYLLRLSGQSRVESAKLLYLK
ncbi:MAG: T9SS type A sorting domain-containing protein [bacterium]|nr:T9SS type A sorting domain-containing protein [bacterium]